MDRARDEGSNDSVESARSGPDAASEPGYRELVCQRMAQLEVPAVWEVGGAVRDGLLGRDCKDVDITVAGTDHRGLVAALRALAPAGKVAPLEVNGQLIGAWFVSDWTGPKGVEVALARTEISTGEGHQNFAIVPIVPPAGREDDPVFLKEAIAADLGRRDFTANALARDLRTDETVDPFRGAEDIRKGVLRQVSADTFRDDPLRVLRGMAAWSRYGLRPEPVTLAAMGEHAHLTEGRGVIDRSSTLEVQPDGTRLEQRYVTLEWADGRRERLAGEVLLHAADADADSTVIGAAQPLPGLSWNRIRMEMEKIHRGPYRGEALRAMRDIGLWRTVLPEMAVAVGFDQRNPYHRMDLDDHTIAVYAAAGEMRDRMPSAEQVDHEVLAWAALQHDVGKVQGAVAKTVDGRRMPLTDCPPEDVATVGYYGLQKKDPETGEERKIVAAHQILSAASARKLMGRAGCEESLIKATEFVIANHMFSDDEKFTDLTDAKQGLRARKAVSRYGALTETMIALRLADRAGKAPGWDGTLDPNPLALLHWVRSERRSAPVLERGDLKRRLGVDGQAFAKAGLQGKQIGECMDHVVRLCIGQPENATAEQVAKWIGHYVGDKKKRPAPNGSVDERHERAKAAP